MEFIKVPVVSLFRSGNLGDLARAGSLHEYLIELHEKYGEIVGFWWGKEYVVSLSAIQHWKEIQPIFDKPCKINQTLTVMYAVHGVLGLAHTICSRDESMTLSLQLSWLEWPTDLGDHWFKSWTRDSIFFSHHHALDKTEHFIFIIYSLTELNICNDPSLFIMTIPCTV